MMAKRQLPSSESSNVACSGLSSLPILFGQLGRAVNPSCKSGRGIASLTASPDEDVEASLTWLNTVDTKYMPSTFNAISFFMRHYHRVACLTREVARKMSVPSKRPGRVDVTEFCQNTRAIWSGVRDLYRDLNMHVEEMLLSCKEEILGFSPVHVSLLQCETSLTNSNSPISGFRRPTSSSLCSRWSSSC